MRQVVVTGANGFIGQSLCAELLQRGWSVRGTIRRIEARRDLVPGIEATVLDVARDDGWLEALSKVDAIVHLVGRTHVLHDRASDALDAYGSVNVEGTQRVLKACVEAGFPHFVYLSSIKAVGRRGTRFLL